MFAAGEPGYCELPHKVNRSNGGRTGTENVIQCGLGHPEEEGPEGTRRRETIMATSSMPGFNPGHYQRRTPTAPPVGVEPKRDVVCVSAREINRKLRDRGLQGLAIGVVLGLLLAVIFTTVF